MPKQTPKPVGYICFLLLLGFVSAIYLAGYSQSNKRPSTKPAEPYRTSIDGTITWSAPPVLIAIQTGSFWINPEWSNPPSLVVYADGGVIWEKYQSGQGIYMHGAIPIEELCNLLIQIDRAGFFDFSMGDYEDPNWTDQGRTRIMIRSWKSRTVTAYALDHAVEENKAPLGLAETYRLLTSLEPENSIPYKPPYGKPYFLNQIAQNPSGPVQPINFELNPKVNLSCQMN